MYLYKPVSAMFLRLFTLLLMRELGLRFQKGHWESLLQVLLLLIVFLSSLMFVNLCLVLWNVLSDMFADCWTSEPEQRSSCSDILCRLLDCEYALC